jgi:hypothetical protein
VGATQADVARYVSRLHEAHRRCRANLKAVDRILSEQEKSLALEKTD